VTEPRWFVAAMVAVILAASAVFVAVQGDRVRDRHADELWCVGAEPGDVGPRSGMECRDLR
jgi:hypothetical protein